MKVLRRLVVRAAPTCTLWVEDWGTDVLRFRWFPKWVITGMELAKAER